MKFFGKGKDKKEDGCEPEELARQLGRMTLDAGSSGIRPSSKNNDSDFVGGFHADHRDRNNGRHKPLPATPDGAGISFPRPIVFQAQAKPPGPLPKPPLVRMPEPTPGWIPSSSRTTQIAQSLWNDASRQPHPQATLGPPTPGFIHHPYSDPSVPTESISAPRPPSTPKRTKPTGPELPATLPPVLSQSLSSSATTPTRPGRQRSASTSAILSPSATRPTSDTRQCEALTQAGVRCTKRIKPSTIWASNGDGELDADVAVYCSVHKGKVLTQDKCRSPVTHDYLNYSDYIPSYLGPATQIQLRALMTKPASKSDTDGFIYVFEIRDDKQGDLIFLKVGRAVSVNKRIDEWASQCGSKPLHLLGFWPELPGHNLPDAMGRLREGRKGKFCHRLERLIHLELLDLVQNKQYLQKGFPSVAQDDSSAATAKLPPRKPCVDCGKRHREIFAFQRAEKGIVFHKHEWELLVKPLIHKWGHFVEEHVVQGAD